MTCATLVTQAADIIQMLYKSWKDVSEGELKKTATTGGTMDGRRRRRAVGENQA